MLTPFANTLLLNFLFNTEIATRPSAWYAAIHTADPGDDGTANEVTVGIDIDYVRKVISFSNTAVFSGDRGILLNSTAVTWTPGTGADYTIAGVSIWDAETGGNCLAQGMLFIPKNVTPASPYTLDAGKLPLVLHDFPEYSSILGLNFLFNSVSATRPTSWYEALHMADPGPNGSANEVTVVEDVDYVRQSITMSAATQQVSNTTQVEWTPGAAANYVISHRSIWDNSVGGNCLVIGQLFKTETGLASIPVVVSIGDDVIAMRP